MRSLRRFFPVFALQLIVACASQQSTQKKNSPDASRPSNFAIVVNEVIEKPVDDVLARTDIFADGQPIGQTNSGPKSYKKNWEGYLAPGNHLIHCEGWILEGVEHWIKDEKKAPWERFVRIDEDKKATLELRYSNAGETSSYNISRTPLPTSGVPAPTLRGPSAMPKTH
jgi:hypothetical protein